MNLIENGRHDICRHADGSINFDFYRMQATACRGAAWRDGRKLKAAFAGLLAIAGSLAASLLIVAAVQQARLGQVLHSAQPQVAYSSMAQAR